MTKEEMIAIALDDCGRDDIDDVVETHETFADFDDSARNHWADGSFVEHAADGKWYHFPTREYDRVQMAKGQPRRRFYLVDLGDLRIVIQ